jgi:hypothetical protein
MNTTSRVLVAMGAVTLMAYGSALAQQAPGQPQTPSPTSPASPPAGQSGAQSSAQTMTATGELTKVDAKEDTLHVKTSTGEMIIKYDDDTKVTGASRNTAGLATMSGSQVTVRYRKEGTSNVATSIEVKPAAGGISPGVDRPSPGDRPSAPGGDPSKPSTPPTPRP